MESVKDELLYLAELNDGVINPHAVVDFASDPGTCLHSRFTWDDSKAAREYRLEQARRIIRLEFEIVHKDSKEIGETRLFVSLSEDRKPEGGYRVVSEILTDEDMRQKMLRDILQELIRIKAKYKSIKEFAGIFSEIDKLQKVITFEKEIV
jgi:DNA-binding cell septation regulator SpoVG